MDELLEQYQRSRSPEDFGLIVRRYLNAVYSQALRRTRDPSKAEDVVQAVFILLCRKAPSLPRGVILGAWLFRATQYACLAAQRAAGRRQRYEREAAAMRAELTSQEKPDDELVASLEDAIGRLSRGDREAVLLRYYEGRTAAEVGQQLGISEEAARKRLSRAMDRLREIIGRRGVAVPAATVTSAMEGAFAQQVSPHLAGAITAAATGAAAPGAGALTIVKGALRIMLVKKLQVATVVVVAGLLAAGSAVPVAMKVMAQAPATQSVAAVKATPAPPAQQGQALGADAKEAIGRELEDTMRRILAASQAGDYQTVCREIWSEAPKERNAFKASLRVSMAVDALRKAAAKLPRTGPTPWDGTVTLAEVLEKTLSLPSGPQDTLEVQGDVAVKRSYFDPVEVFGEELGNTAEVRQWVGVPNYYRRTGERWVWDTDQTFTFKTVGITSDPADQYGKEKAVVRVFDAMAEAMTRSADGIRQGKHTTQAAAVNAFGQVMAARMGQMGNVSVNMVPAEQK